MQIKFLKDCPWSYKLTKRKGGSITKHKKDETAHVDSVEAMAMIQAGYAEECKPKHKPLEHKKSKKKKKVIVNE